MRAITGGFPMRRMAMRIFRIMSEFTMCLRSSGRR